MDTIYQDIAARTGGDIYIGVVGPVRTGKSTLIRRIMEQMVIPGLEDPYRAERAKDELPQSGSGKTIMTTEPKFVPEEAAEISPDGTTRLKVRFIDSVGYMVPGAMGAEEDGAPRMVTTPWYDRELPMDQAAELGTKKVMEQHASIGLVVTTDGSITEIPREDYITAERKAITDMIKTGKPFLIIINTRNPGGEAARTLERMFLEDYHVQPIVADCRNLDSRGVEQILRQLLYTFPMTRLEVRLPRWMDVLEPEHPVKKQLYQTLREKAEEITDLGRAEKILSGLQEMEQVQDFSLQGIDLGNGVIRCAIMLPEQLYYETISSRSGFSIENDAQLLSVLTQLSQIKREYDQIADALSAVKATGYGIVSPAAEEMVLQTPEIIRKGSSFGVKLKAGAPSIHMIRVDIDTEISPMVGDEKQSRELMAHLTGGDPELLWQSNIFGKSVYDLIQEGLSAKLTGMNEDVRGKFRGTLGRIVNEGASGLICLIL